MKEKGSPAYCLCLSINRLQVRYVAFLLMENTTKRENMLELKSVTTGLLSQILKNPSDTG